MLTKNEQNLLILIFLIVVYFTWKMNNLQEKFVDLPTIINPAATPQLYAADAEAVKLLSNFAIQLSNGGTTIPGNVIFTGAITTNSNITATAGTGVITGKTITATGDINATAGTVNAKDITATGAINVTGNITTTNGAITTTNGTVTAKDITATGAINVTGNTTTTNGNITTTNGTVTAATITGNNINSLGNITANTGTGIITGKNINSLGDITANTGTGIITGKIINGTTITATGNISTAGLTSTGPLTSAGLTSTGNITASAGTISGAAITSAGNITASAGTITGAAIISTGNITAGAGTITGANITSTGNITAGTGTITGSLINSTGSININGDLLVMNNKPDNKNKWVIQAPNDDRKALYFARWNSQLKNNVGDWDWTNEIAFTGSTGMITCNGIFSRGNLNSEWNINATNEMNTKNLNATGDIVVTGNKDASNNYISGGFLTSRWLRAIGDFVLGSSISSWIFIPGDILQLWPRKKDNTDWDRINNIIQFNSSTGVISSNGLTVKGVNNASSSSQPSYEGRPDAVTITTTGTVTCKEIKCDRFSINGIPSAGIYLINSAEAGQHWSLPIFTNINNYMNMYQSSGSLAAQTGTQVGNFVSIASGTSAAGAKDDAYIVYPGYGIIVYNAIATGSRNATFPTTGITLNFKNTGTLPVSVAPSSRGRSCRIFYNDEEIKW